MKILESELRRRLLGDDDDVVRSTLRRYFRPEPRFTAPLVWDWVPLPDLHQVLGDEEGGMVEAVSRRFIDLANAADAALRKRRFDRRRRMRPDLPVVLCEGDSWISHPFIDDIGDHLFDDGRDAFNVRNRGSAGDRLEVIAREREHEASLKEIDAAVLLLSGGGNDLLLQFHEFLHRRPHPEGTEPSRLVTEALDVRLGELMALMRGIVQGVRTTHATIPIVVHGYDYLRVDAPGEGKFLGLHFDTAGIEGPTRQATLDHVVDRFNEHLCATVATMPGVRYADLRGTVPASEWYDEIHPDENGFARVAKVLGVMVRGSL